MHEKKMSKLSSTLGEETSKRAGASRVKNEVGPGADLVYRGVHGTGGSGICKYPDPFQMFGILKFKIRSQIHKKKSPFRFVPIFRDKTVRFSVLVEISNRTRRNGYSDKNIKTLKKKLFMKSLATISITRL